MTIVLLIVDEIALRDIKIKELEETNASQNIKIKELEETNASQNMHSVPNHTTVNVGDDDGNETIIKFRNEEVDLNISEYLKKSICINGRWCTDIGDDLRYVKCNLITINGDKLLIEAKLFERFPARVKEVEINKELFTAFINMFDENNKYKFPQLNKVICDDLMLTDDMIRKIGYSNIKTLVISGIIHSF